MSNEPFFQADGNRRYRPNDVCRGPWDRESLHGRVVAGLMAHEIELAHGDPGFQPARLTVDLYRLPPFAPVEVETRLERDGNRIRVVDATFTSGGVTMGRASCVMLRRTDNPEGQVWSPETWDAPHPDTLDPPEWQGEGEPMWDTRAITGRFGVVGPKRAWLRETRLLADGVSLSPFVRAAFAADFTNPFANSGSNGLQFVNADITLYLHRLPQGEWIGFDVIEHRSSDGIALGECAVYDLDGPIGRSTVCAVASRKKLAVGGDA